MARNDIVHPYQDDAASPGCLDAKLITGLQAGLAQRLGGDRSLVLAADSRPSSLPMLYFIHPMYGKDRRLAPAAQGGAARQPSRGMSGICAFQGATIRCTQSVLEAEDGG